MDQFQKQTCAGNILNTGPKYCKDHKHMLAFNLFLQTAHTQEVLKSLLNWSLDNLKEGRY